MDGPKRLYDHCRIGSLEKQMRRLKRAHSDHCRIGSLENRFLLTRSLIQDHCRIGSLEMHWTAGHYYTS